jgi:hypothetical protein
VASIAMMLSPYPESSYMKNKNALESSQRMGVNE